MLCAALVLALGILAQQPQFPAPELPPTAEIGPEVDPRVYPSPQSTMIVPRKGANYGVDVRHIGQGPKIRGSDPNVLKRVEDDLANCPGPRCPNQPEPERPKPGPIKRVENSINLGVAAIVAGLLFLGGLILVTRRQRQ